jgi:hypothetical protein
MIACLLTYSCRWADRYTKLFQQVQTKKNEVITQLSTLWQSQEVASLLPNGLYEAKKQSLAHLFNGVLQKLNDTLILDLKEIRDEWGNVKNSVVSEEASEILHRCMLIFLASKIDYRVFRPSNATFTCMGHGYQLSARFQKITKPTITSKTFA